MSGKILDPSGDLIKEPGVLRNILDWLCKYWKSYLPILGIVFSISALIVSVASYHVSKEALSSSTKHFFMENKPYIYYSYS